MINDIVITGKLGPNIDERLRIFKGKFYNPFEGDGTEHEIEIPILHYTRALNNPITEKEIGQAAVIRGHLEQNEETGIYILVELIEYHAS